MVQELGMDDADTAWVQRFGQVGRIAISHRGVRAVTWLTAPTEEYVELHFWSFTKGVVTLRQGGPGILDDMRQDFVERFADAMRSHYHGATILLQLLLGPLDRAMGFIDERLHAVKVQIQSQPGSIDFAQLSRELELLSDIWLRFERYAAAVRSAMVGIAAIPGIDPDGVRELNQYLEHVEDVESRLQLRFQLGLNVVQDYTAALTQRQSEQINRLTVVSVIFLPINFLAGYFGMNFNWMNERLGSGWVYLALGVLLPLACAGVTVRWLKRKGLL